MKTLAAVPDRYQDDRISLIMTCDEKPHNHLDHMLGLLTAPKALMAPRGAQQYAADLQCKFAYDRYVEGIREMSKLQSVFIWLQAHRSMWAWMERDLARAEEIGARQATRVDYSARREDENPPVPILDNHTHSDSDMPLTHDSDDEEEEDYEADLSDPLELVIVEGAGLDAVNGSYQRSDTFDNVGKYSMVGTWNGGECVFSLFRCNTSNNTKHWYISIVPDGVQPGTSTDIDFYSAPLSESSPWYPPSSGWTKSEMGHNPVPAVIMPNVGTQNDSGGGVLTPIDKYDGNRRLL